MLQSTTLDSHMVTVRADAESDMQGLPVFLKQSTREKKEKLLTRFLDFAQEQYVTDPSFKFNREELQASNVLCQRLLYELPIL